MRTSSQVPLVEVDVDPALYMHRRNSSPEALGRFKRRRLCGLDCFFSGDCWAWYIPTALTFWIVVGNIAVAWPIIGWFSLSVVLTLVTTGFVASYLVTCTDPGVYPRLKPAEADPLAGYEGLVFCRVCQIRRPPRTSHCYQCNVCVLDHDHHCGVLGGCVGMRSLRWFTLFLVCQPTACCIGMYWLLVFLLTFVYEMGLASDPTLGNATAASTATLPAPNFSTFAAPPFARRGHHHHQHLRESSETDLVALRYVGAVFMLLIDLVIIMLVGGLATVYVYLTVSSTTRRESRKRETSFKICCQPLKMLANIKYTAYPPSSLLTESRREAVETQDLV